MPCIFHWVVRLPGLEPGWLPIRPSNVRVCLFRHNRICLRQLYYNSIIPFVLSTTLRKILQILVRKFFHLSEKSWRFLEVFSFE